MPEISQEELLKLMETKPLPDKIPKRRPVLDKDFWAGLASGLLIAAILYAFCFIMFALF